MSDGRRGSAASSQFPVSSLQVAVHEPVLASLAVHSLSDCRLAIAEHGSGTWPRKSAFSVRGLSGRGFPRALTQGSEPGLDDGFRPASARPLRPGFGPGLHQGLSQASGQAFERGFEPPLGRALDPGLGHEFDPALGRASEPLLGPAFGPASVRVSGDASESPLARELGREFDRTLKPPAHRMPGSELPGRRGLAVRHTQWSGTPEPLFLATPICPEATSAGCARQVRSQKAKVKRQTGPNSRHPICREATIPLTLFQTVERTFGRTFSGTFERTITNTFASTFSDTIRSTFSGTIRETVRDTVRDTVHETLDDRLRDTIQQTLR